VSIGWAGEGQVARAATRPLEGSVDCVNAGLLTRDRRISEQPLLLKSMSIKAETKRPAWMEQKNLQDGPFVRNLILGKRQTPNGGRAAKGPIFGRFPFNCVHQVRISKQKGQVMGGMVEVSTR
jgi:hypothetical protein